MRRAQSERRSAASRQPCRGWRAEPAGRAGAHHRTAKTGSNTELRGRFEQLPREELIDADAKPAVTRQAFVSTKVVGESAVDRRTHRRDPARDEQLLR